MRAQAGLLEVLVLLLEQGERREVMTVSIEPGEVVTCDFGELELRGEVSFDLEDCTRSLIVVESVWAGTERIYEGNVARGFFYYWGGRLRVKVGWRVILPIQEAIHMGTKVEHSEHGDGVVVGRGVVADTLLVHFKGMAPGSAKVCRKRTLSVRNLVKKGGRRG